jgi:hypothetical protein
MHKISVTPFATTIFKPRNLECFDKFSDFLRHKNIFKRGAYSALSAQSCQSAVQAAFHAPLERRSTHSHRDDGNEKNEKTVLSEAQ